MDSAITPLNLLLATAASLLALNLLKFLSWRIKLRHIDGPTPLPIVGNLLMKHATSSTRFINQMCKKFGKTFLYWPGATNPMIVILEPMHVRQVLTDVHIWVKGDDYKYIFSVMMGQGLVTSDRVKHKEDRKMFARFFVRHHVEKFIPLMNRHVMSKINQYVNQNEVAQNVDVSELWLDYTSCTFSSFAFSKDLNATEEWRKFCSFAKTFTGFGEAMCGECIILGLPISPWLNSKRRKYDKLNNQFVHYMNQMLDERKELRKHTPEEEPDDIIKVMLDADLTYTDMRDHFITMLAAGVDTTAWLLSYTCYMLALHPDVQRKAHEEIQKVMGDRGELTVENVKELKYVNMCLRETMRYYGIVPFLTRTATKDVTLTCKKSYNAADTDGGDVFVPKGSTVLISMSVMHRSEDQWKDPKLYIPERFENVGDQSIQKGYIPFSYGTRTCIGNTLAVVEATVAVAHLLSKYSLEPIKGWKPKPALGITLHEKNGMHINLVQKKKYD